MTVVTKICANLYQMIIKLPHNSEIGFIEMLYMQIV